MFVEYTKSWYNLRNWSQVAVFMENNDKVKGIIKQVSFYISKNPAFKAPFRIRIYKVNKDGSPGEDLIFENIIHSAKRKNKWLEIDVSHYRIPIPLGGYFVAMEWIYTNNKFFYIQEIGDEKKQVYGQCLGNTLCELSGNQQITWLYALGKGWRKDNRTYEILKKQYGRNALITSKVIMYSKD